MYLILAILSACIFSVMFRLCTLWKADIRTAMAANYIFGAIIFGKGILLAGIPVWILGTISGSLFILGFVARNICTDKYGISMATGATRASLIVPVLLGWLILDHQTPPWTAIIFVLLGMILFSYDKGGKFGAGLPTLLIINGLCSFSLPLARHLDMESGITTGCIFISAALLSSAICIRKIFSNETKEEKEGKTEVKTRKGINNWIKSAICGILIGASNAGTVFFSLEALGSMDATIFYPAYNGGILIICTAIGITVFHERPRKIQIIGLILAAVGTIAVTIG